METQVADNLKTLLLVDPSCPALQQLLAGLVGRQLRQLGSRWQDEALRRTL